MNKGINNPGFRALPQSVQQNILSNMKYYIICWGGKTIKGLTVAYAGYLGLRGLMRILGMPMQPRPKTTRLMATKGCHHYAIASIHKYPVPADSQLSFLRLLPSLSSRHFPASRAQPCPILSGRKQSVCHRGGVGEHR